MVILTKTNFSSILPHKTKKQLVSVLLAAVFLHSLLANLGLEYTQYLIMEFMTMSSITLTI